MVFDDVRLKGFSKTLKVDEAIQSSLTAFKLFPMESISLKNSNIQNRILREDIYATRSIPPFDRSAVDGYAIRAEDTFSASETNPMLLKVIGKLNIGELSPVTIKKGSVAQIPTGGVIPSGANAVVMIEDTSQVSQDYIEVYSVLHPGKNVSKAGEDIKKDQQMFQSGHRLRSIDRGFLLSAGINNIKVSLSPSVAIIATGDELLEPWENITHGKIPEINTTNLYDLCWDEGWNSTILGIFKDERNSLQTIIEDSIKKFDVILVNGGTSVGKKDYVPIILNEIGTVLFHGVAIRPGSPIMCATVQDKIIFGVPGFPTATIISFRFIIKPIIRSLMGMKNPFSSITVQAVLSRNVGSKLGRLDYLRVKLKKLSSGKYQAIPIQIGGSGILKNIVDASGFIPIPESSEGLKEGDIVEVEVW
ncbi:MAG: molybdopterin molybdotransferase MoeA [Candidatus Hodarchaeales archaeon]